MASQPFTVSVTTSFVALPSYRCSSFSLLNSTGADLFVARADQTAETDKIITIPTGKPVTLVPNENCKEFAIKADTGATGVHGIAELKQ